MNKRTFMKLGSAALMSPIVRPLLTWAGAEKLTNWAGNIEYSTQQQYSATSLDEVRAFVKKQNKLKVLGTRHCFNKIADSPDQFLSLKAMDKAVQ